MHDRLEIRCEGNRVVLAGELDAVSGDELVRTLDAIDGTADIIDLGRVTFIDSGGIHTLIDLRGARDHLRVENARPEIVRVLDIVGVTEQVLGR